MSGLAAQITTDAEINTCLTLWVLLAKALGHLGRIALVRSLRRKHEVTRDAAAVTSGNVLR